MTEYSFTNLSKKLQVGIRDCLNDNTDTQMFKRELNDTKTRFLNKVFHASGGMKHIYKVRDLHTSRIVALATLKGSDLHTTSKVEAFVREARITAALEHPNIIPIYDIGIDKYETPYFTMKFLSDESLYRILKELSKQNPYYTRKYSLTILLDIFLKVCDAVLFAHSREVVHLDIKPQNIMIGEYGEVYLCDWGLAKVLGETQLVDEDIFLDPVVSNTITLEGQIKGTPGFMAPEQIDDTYGEKDYTSDVYALGAVLYNLLTFKAPFFDTKPHEVISKSLQSPPKDVEKVSYFPVHSSLVAICKKAISIKKEDRYQSVQTLIDELRAFLNGFAPKAENASLGLTLRLFYLRNKFKLNIFVTALISLMMIGFVAVSRINKSKHAAVLSSQQARKSEQKAKLAEKQALANLRDLKKKEKEMKSISKFAAIQLTNEAWKDYLSRNYKSAYAKVKSSLALYDDDPRAWDLKGQLEFTVLNIDVAIEDFTKSRNLFTGLNRGVLEQYLALCRELKNEHEIDKLSVDINKIVEVMDKYKLKNYRAMYYFLPLRLKNSDFNNQ